MGFFFVRLLKEIGGDEDMTPGPQEESVIR